MAGPAAKILGWQRERREPRAAPCQKTHLSHPPIKQRGGLQKTPQVISGAKTRELLRGPDPLQGGLRPPLPHLIYQSRPHLIDEPQRGFATCPGLHSHKNARSPHSVQGGSQPPEQRRHPGFATTHSGIRSHLCLLLTHWAAQGKDACQPEPQCSHLASGAQAQHEQEFPGLVHRSLAQRHQSILELPHGHCRALTRPY